MLIPDVPVLYFKDFAFDESGRVVWMPELSRDDVIPHLATLDWADRTPTRMEYFVADIEGSYTYGEGVGERTYEQQEWTPFLRGAQHAVQDFYGTTFEVLFLNRYMNERNWLGWHADNGAIMDHERPIALITFGAERVIQFAPYEDKKHVRSLKLEHGSLCLMKPGMQITHVHRIPKAGFKCGERVSFTFRGYKAPVVV